MTPGLRWERRVAELEEFHRLHDHTRVPATHGGNAGLKQWVTVQRRQARTGKLTEERRRRLDALGLDWNPQPRNAPANSTPMTAEMRWERRIAELEEFQRVHGHLGIPKRGETSGLKQWMTVQRRMARTGKLTEERRRRLDALGLDWNPPLLKPHSDSSRRTGEMRWESRYAELEEYQRVHGHLSIPKQGETSGLSQWVKVQRRQARAGTLAVEQWWRLTALGFDWNPPGSEWNPGEHGWEARMNELRAYQSRHGHCRVSRFCAECPALARWVIAVRKRYREGKLRPERAGALEQMGFAWDAKPAQDVGRWQGQFARLVKFRERFGHCRVPAKWREDTVLGGWVGNQRAFRKRGTLSAERVAQLESVGFEWQLYSGYARSPEERWEQMFARLLDYRREHGGTLVPPRFRGIKGLRRWVIAQRRQGDALRPDWRERLEAIGFRWGGIERSHDEQWALRLAHLLGFRQRFGHCRVPAKWKEDAALGGWVHNQRAFKKKGTLSPERIAQLEVVGFEWHDRWDTSADEHWQRMCAHVERYRQEHGHADVPPGFREVRGLNKWVVHQRQGYRLGELRGDRVAQLEAIGFAWKTTDRLNRARWERRFGQLAAYRWQYGHCRVPAKWREDAAFGAWVHTQRASKRKGTLSPERIRQLDELGFEWAG